MKQKIVDYVINTAGPELVKCFKQTVERIGIWLQEQCTWEKVQERIEEILSKQNVKITIIEVGELDKETLIEFAKQNIVSNSNEVLAMLNTQNPDGDYVYLAYSKDREMLPEDENNYVIIKANEAKKDVRTLFGNNELIILK